MKIAEDLRSKAKELLLKGASVSCKEIEGQPGRYICKAIIPNDDGKTYREGQALVELYRDEKTGRTKLKLLPYGDSEKNDTLAQYVIVEHLKILYGAEEGE